MVTLDEAKIYLRVDSSFEDSLISSLLLSAESLCMDVARLSAAEKHCFLTAAERKNQ